MKFGELFSWLILTAGLVVGMLYCNGCAAAHAAEITVGYAPGCYHYDRDKDYNERNHLFMVSVNQWFGMTFDNSFDDQSYAVGYVFRTKKWGLGESELYLRGELPTGIVYGYGDHRKINIGGFSPALLPTLEVGYGPVALHVVAFPIVAVMFSVTF